MTKRGRRLIENPARLPKTERKLFGSPVAAVDGRLIRPHDLLVDIDREGELAPILERNKGRRYEPGDPRNDFRQKEGAPPYGDINARLREREAGVQLWTGFDVESVARLVEDERVRGLHYNHVFVGEDFYHGGPGGAPAEVAGPDSLPTWEGDGINDVAVLDNGLPSGTDKLHPELHLAVTRSGAVGALAADPMDEDFDHVLDKQAGHGLFICGLINRFAPELNIRLHRVLHASGEGDESLIAATLLELDDSVKVINMSLGAFIPGKDGPAMEHTIRQLVANGKIVIASAGNAGGTPFGPGALFPARMPEVLAVGAYDSQTGKVWDKSCRGDVYAPGVDTLSAHVTWHGLIDWADSPGAHAFAGWAAWSGTSFAAPLVATEIAKRLAKPHAGSAQDVVNDWLASLCTEDWPNKNGGTPTPRYDLDHVTDWG